MGKNTVIALGYNLLVTSVMSVATYLSTDSSILAFVVMGSMLTVDVFCLCVNIRRDRKANTIHKQLRLN